MINSAFSERSIVCVLCDTIYQLTADISNGMLLVSMACLAVAAVSNSTPDDRLSRLVLKAG